MRRRLVPALAVSAVIILLAVGLVWTARGQSPVTPGRSPVTKDEIGDEVQTVPRGELPVFAGEGDTGALYRFATTRGDAMRYVPCTCGCAEVGHTSNRSCYIKAESDASVTYTSHAAT